MNPTSNKKSRIAKDTNNPKLSFACPLCGNTDPRLIGLLNGKPYCRRCISFKGEEAELKPLYPKKAPIRLSYELSPEQKQLSDKLVENYKNGIDTLVYAVCGSGKTEISYALISYALSKGQTVGFALPRRDVVIELYGRIREVFPRNTIIPVYGGHTSKLEGDCIILTTHQLYRYPHYFDLLIMDEIDAFPFKDSEVLHAFYKNSMRGHCLLMSATPSKKVVDEFKGEGKDILTLHTRFHKKPIPVPRTILSISYGKFIELVKILKRFVKEKKPVMVFVPTIYMSIRLWRWLSLFVKHGTYINSKRCNRDLLIADFKKGVYQYVVTTAVLERGVTVKNCQVVVYNADDRIYSSATLIQISGRAGRKIDAPNGEVIFIAEEKTKEIENAIHEIEYCNSFLQGVHEKF